VSVTTLEEVFLRVGHDEAVDTESKKELEQLRRQLSVSRRIATPLPLVRLHLFVVVTVYIVFKSPIRIQTDAANATGAAVTAPVAVTVESTPPKSPNGDHNHEQKTPESAYAKGTVANGNGHLKHNHHGSERNLQSGVKSEHYADLLKANFSMERVGFRRHFRALLIKRYHLHCVMRIAFDPGHSD